MHKYKFYQTIDFLCDDDFIEWVCTPCQETDLYWQQVFAHFPAIKNAAEEARQVLKELHIKPLEGRTAALQDYILAKAFAPEVQGEKQLRLLTGHTVYKWMVAALLLLLAGAVVFLQQPGRQAKLKIVEINHAGKQEVKNTASKALLVLLPDQSTVILQPKASIQYAKNAFAFKREIYLAGEAFFDVSKNEQIPFVVQTDQLTTTVLGTSFFVKAVPDASTHQVRVATGAVQVQKKGEINRLDLEKPKQLILHAGEEVLVRTDEPLRAVTAVREPVHHVEERKKIFDFQHMQMREVAKVLEAEYGLTVRIRPEMLAERTITASLANMSLQEKLHIIAEVVEAQYQLEDGIVIFSLNTNQK